MQLLDNGLNASDFLALRQAVGWEADLNQITRSLEKGLFNVVAQDDDGQTLGMGRLVGDGVMYWYVQDVIVRPDAQGQGIGQAIMARLLAYVDAYSLPGTRVTVGLMAAKGKVGFYEKLGFIPRPNDTMDPGMVMFRLIPSPLCLENPERT